MSDSLQSFRLQSFHDWYHYGIRLLSASGIADAKTDVWLLMEHATGITRSWYLLHGDESMPADAAAEYSRLLTERGRRIPLQYLTGQAWFYGNCFSVSPAVLIPRQDTETLVEEAAGILETGWHILDMCTGSGCILLSLLKSCPNVTGTGTDLSPEALDIARKNRRALGVQEDRAVFYCGDLFEALPAGEEYDVILSNPPYIPTGVIDGLDPEVRDHEPYQALDGHEDGLYFEEKIAEEARRHFRKGQKGYLFLEIGYDQGTDIRRILERLGYHDICITKDLGGNDRVAGGRYLR